MMAADLLSLLSYWSFLGLGSILAFDKAVVAALLSHNLLSNHIHSLTSDIILMGDLKDDVSELLIGEVEQVKEKTVSVISMSNAVFQVLHQLGDLLDQALVTTARGAQGENNLAKSGGSRFLNDQLRE